MENKMPAIHPFVNELYNLEGYRGQVANVFANEKAAPMAASSWTKRLDEIIREDFMFPGGVAVISNNPAAIKSQIIAFACSANLNRGGTTLFVLPTRDEMEQWLTEAQGNEFRALLKPTRLSNTGSLDYDRESNMVFTNYDFLLQYFTHNATGCSDLADLWSSISFVFLPLGFHLSDVRGGNIVELTVRLREVLDGYQHHECLTSYHKEKPFSGFSVKYISILPDCYNSLGINEYMTGEVAESKNILLATEYAKPSLIVQWVPELSQGEDSISRNDVFREYLYLINSLLPRPLALYPDNKYVSSSEVAEIIRLSDGKENVVDLSTVGHSRPERTVIAISPSLEGPGIWEKLVPGDRLIVIMVEMAGLWSQFDGPAGLNYVNPNAKRYLVNASCKPISNRVIRQKIRSRAAKDVNVSLYSASDKTVKLSLPGTSTQYFVDASWAAIALPTQTTRIMEGCRFSIVGMNEDGVTVQPLAPEHHLLNVPIHRLVGYNKTETLRSDNVLGCEMETSCGEVTLKLSAIRTVKNLDFPGSTVRQVDNAKDVVLQSLVLEMTVPDQGIVRALKHLLKIGIRRKFIGDHTGWNAFAGDSKIIFTDLVPGGAGCVNLLNQDTVTTALSEAYDSLVKCPCDGGCYSCLHVPDCSCEQANALDKGGIIKWLGSMLGKDSEHDYHKIYG